MMHLFNLLLACCEVTAPSQDRVWHTTSLKLHCVVFVLWFCTHQTNKLWQSQANCSLVLQSFYLSEVLAVASYLDESGINLLILEKVNKRISHNDEPVLWFCVLKILVVIYSNSFANETEIKTTMTTSARADKVNPALRRRQTGCFSQLDQGC